MENLKISGKNEATMFPFWVIINPRQNFHTNECGLHQIAGMITGVWFSRERAQAFFDAKKHRFGNGAAVFCMSGHNSSDWRALCEQIMEPCED